MNAEQPAEQEVDVPSVTELLWPTFQVMVEAAGQPMRVSDIDLRVADRVGLGPLDDLPENTRTTFRERMRSARTALGPKMADLIEKHIRGEWKLGRNLVEGEVVLPSSEEELYSIYRLKKREYDRERRQSRKSRDSGSRQRRAASQEEQTAHEQAEATTAEEELPTSDEDVSFSALAAKTPPSGSTSSDRLTHHVRQLADTLRREHHTLIEEQYQLRMELQKLRERASELEQHLNENREEASKTEQQFNRVKDDLEQVGVQIPPLEN